MFIRTTIAAALVLFAGTIAWAAGGGETSGSGNVDRAAQSEEYRLALEAIKAKDYAKALGYLDQVVEQEPDSADAWNYKGYSHRHLKQFDASLAAYQEALKIDPKHRGAHEYLGELYLDTNQLDKAKAQLERIDDLCFLTCKEYRELKKAIKKFEAG